LAKLGHGTLYVYL